MRRIDRVSVVGIKRVSAILPDVDMAEAFLPQLVLERAGVFRRHGCLSATSGSTLIARRAGIQHPSAAAAANTAVAMT